MAKYNTGLTEKQTLVYTVIGEARNNRLAQSSVAHNILNRYYSGRYGSSITGVIMSRGQYSMWNDVTGYAGGRGGNSASVIARTSQSRYEQAESVVNEALAGGKDPTGGALNYYNPSTASPSWGRGSPGWSETTEIGGHAFGTSGGASHYTGENPNDPRYGGNIGETIGYGQFSNANVSEEVANGSFSQYMPYNPEYNQFSSRNVSENVENGNFGMFGMEGTGTEKNENGEETAKSFSSDPKAQEQYVTGEKVSSPRAGSQGNASSVPVAIVSAANQEAQAATSSAKTTAEATLNAAKTTAESEAKLQQQQQSWGSNWAVRIFLFLTGLIFVGGGLFLFGGQTIFQTLTKKAGP